MGIHVEGVSKWVLRDCSFELPSGSVTALVGANGAGKTTLLSLLAGLLSADSGQVRADGRVAFVAQDKPLYKHFTATDALSFGKHTNKVWDQERAVGWLSRFGVPLKRASGRLSGGQRAHISFAVALGSRPDVLLLDEPLSELDPLVRKEVTAALLGFVADEGTTLVLSTHVVSELSGVADRLLLLAQGELLVSGEVDDLLGSHVSYVGPVSTAAPGPGDVVLARHTAAQSQFLVRTPSPVSVAEPWVSRPVSLEDLVLAHLEVAE
ncbi:ABC transporter ATP-binding protein [Lentzea tibetensis]|uniref:ABC transporter ATP-binding protein n=1 Tax=Lentzea tibetensis TaxID=2591470 RepID=A0A563EMD3_9PSEU|nr:ABC transporter ATP-binding protein [Lentzea tibetensis]TWP48319.1 ABC transporter ATP-binding protein [Lentzea tibetensis]